MCLKIANQPRRLIEIEMVMCMPSRKENSFILDTMAKFNKHLNTEKWRIASRRHIGATKLTLFIRMDIDSFEMITTQNNKINWILSQVVVE